MPDRVPADRLVDLLCELDVERKITLARAKELYGGRMSDATWKRVKKRLEKHGCALRWDAKRRAFFVVDPLWTMERRGSRSQIRTRLALVRTEAAALGPPYGETLARLFERWDAQLADREPGDEGGPPPRRPHPRADDGFYDRLNVIEVALRDRRMLRFSYTKTAGGKAKERQVEPYGLHDNEGRFYLWGRERVRQAPKFFAVDLMRDAVLEERFDADAHFDLDEALRYSFGTFVRADAKPSPILVEIDAESAAYVRARRWPAESRIEDMPDGRLRIEFTVTDPQEVVSWVIGFGGAARVVSPASAADLARRAAERMAEAHAWAKVAPKGDGLLEFEWSTEG